MPSPGHDQPAALGPAATWFAALQRRARARRWLAAVAVGAITGVLANLAVDWPLTLAAVLVTAAGLLLWDRSHGTLASWWPTGQGLHRLAATAAGLEKRGWIVLHIPDRAPAHTYLFIGPGGVFVVQQQAWPVITSPSNGLLLVGGRPAIRRVAPLRATTTSVAVAIADSPAPTVRAVLAIEGKTAEDPRVVSDVTIVPTTGLTRLLNRGGSSLTPAEVEAIGAAARRTLTDPSDVE